MRRYLMRYRRAAGVLVFTGFLVCAISVSAQQSGEPPALRFTVTGFDVQGENPLSEGDTERLLSAYLGEHEGLAGVQDAAAALEEALVSAGYAFHRVIVPPQRAAGGRFTLQVLSFKLDKVTVTGNEHFDRLNILRSLPGLEPGTTPSNRDLSPQLGLANEHTAKNLRITIRESARPDFVDAEVKVKDRSPITAFAAFNNRGSHETGRYRASVGAQHANLFGLDHTATVSMTSSPGHWEDVLQGGVFYRAPLYRFGGAVNAFYTRSTVDSGEVGNLFSVSGSGQFMGVSYRQVLPEWDNYRQWLNIGIQDRLFGNDSTLADGTPLPAGAANTDVRSRPLSLSYQGQWRSEWGRSGFNVTGVYNLPGGAHNDSATYALSRVDAPRDWFALRFNAFADVQLTGGALMRTRVSGQQARDALIAGERFGIGGASSVRGFEEREFSGDDAVQVNFELWSPPLDSLIGVEGLRVLAFGDNARVFNHRAQPGDLQRINIASLGLGMRWVWREALNLSVDVAHVIRGSGASSTHDGRERVHFNLFYRF